MTVQQPPDLDDAIEHLHEHRHTYRQSRFVWFDEDAQLVAEDLFRCRKPEFTTVADMRLLLGQRSQMMLQAGAVFCAFGDIVNRIHTEYPDAATRRLAPQFGISPIQYAASRQHAAWTTWAASAQSPHVQRILGIYRRSWFSGTMILAWELKQMLDLQRAAEAMIEDACADLATELLETQPDAVRVLCETEGHLNFELWLSEHLRDRGHPGDRRRRNAMVFPAFDVPDIDPNELCPSIDHILFSQVN